MVRDILTSIDLQSLISILHFGGALIGQPTIIPAKVPKTEPIFTFPFSDERIDFHPGKSYKTLYDVTKNLLFKYRDKKIGLPLSGGIDSTTILYLVQDINKKENLNISVKAYNQVFDFRDESRYAQQIADQTETELEIIHQTTSQNLKEFDEILKIFPEPIMGNAHMNTIYKKMKKDGNISAISALGGDECWGGYPSHRIFHDNLFSKHIYQAQGIRAKLLRVLFTPICKQQLWIRYNLRFNPKKQFLNPRKYRKATKNIGNKLISNIRDSQYIWFYYNYLDVSSKLPNNGRFNLWDANEHYTFTKCEKLYKHQINGVGVLNGLEILFPFLEPDYVKYSLAIDKTNKIKDGISKWGMRQMMKDKIPENLLMRGAYGDKMGWGELYQVLWENGYKEFSEELLTKEKVEELGILNWALINKALNNLNKRFRGAEARTLITMSLFQKILELKRL